MPDKIHTETLIPSGFTFQMRFIPGGTFNMGSADTDKYARDNEKPLRKNINVSPFYLAPYTVTQALWKAVMSGKNNPSNFKGDQNPVEKVYWYDTQEFIKSINKQTLISRQNNGLGEYRLPTEVEWEYAARCASLNSDYLFAGSDKLKEVGWYRLNSENETHEVGLLMPNQLGIYDLSGNVWEWIQDNWHANYKGAPKDSRAWLSDDKVSARVVRGGSFFNVLQNCRVSYRSKFAWDYRSGHIGFRLALSTSLRKIHSE